MEILKAETEIFKFKLNNFEDYKNKILHQIKDMGIHSDINHVQQISNTDYNLSENVQRTYFQNVLELTQPCIRELCDTYNYSINYLSYWFQQYKKGDFHGNHTHPSCTYSSVIYLELPENTETKFIQNGKEVAYKVNEGDFIIFPSNLVHCSPINLSNKTKTIISINFDFSVVHKK